MIPAMVAGAGFGLNHVQLLRSVGFQVRALLLRPSSSISDLDSSIRSIVVRDISEAPLRGIRLAAVVTPPDTHREIVAACLTAGVDIVCDKPLAPTHEAASELAALAKSGGGRSAVFFQWRFCEPFGAIRLALLEGRLGELIEVRVRAHGDFLRNRTTRWRWRHEVARSGAGALNDLGVHGIDLVRWITGDEIAVTTATSLQKFQWRDVALASDVERVACETEDLAVASGTLSSGASIELEASRIAEDGFIEVFVRGTRAEIGVKCALDGQVMHVRSRGITLPTPRESQVLVNPYSVLSEAWYGNPPIDDYRIASFWDATAAAGVVEAIINIAKYHSVQ